MEKWAEVRRRVLTGELSKREQPVVGPHLAWIHEVLEHDEQEPVKQRHTAKRIFDCLKIERGYTGGYRW